MADRYDDRFDRSGDRFYGRDWYDRDRDWQRERERMDREAQGRMDRSGYRLGDSDSGRWRDPALERGDRGWDDRGRDGWDRGGREQDWSGRPDRWRSRDQGGYGGDSGRGGDWGRLGASGMSSYDDRDRQGRMSGDLGRQPAFDNYSGAGRDWGERSDRRGERWGGDRDDRTVYVARGEHAGKGPKGYQRSDERIREEVSDQLSDHGEIDASDIEVKVQGGEVTLSGTVMDRRQKRLAEDCAENVRGVRDVHNQLRVQQGQGNVGGIMGEQMQGRGTRSGQEPGGEAMQSNEVIGNSAPGTSSAGTQSRNPRG